MQESIFTVVSKKIVATVIAIGSMFYSTISGVVAEFDDIQLRAKGDQLVLSTGLLNCFSEDLDRIFSSGREIRIQYLVQVFGAPDEEPFHEMTFYHAVEYSLVDGVYEVFRSADGEQFEGLTLERAKEMLSQINEITVVLASQLSFGVEYSVKVQAHMGNIQLPGSEDELNLMFYWSSLKPTAISDSFTKEIFRQ